MPRSSRHRSHRGHRHERERSGSASSEEEEVERVGSRRRRDGSPPPPPEDFESSKRRKASSPPGRAGLEGANAADPAGDQGGGSRKRKDRDSRPPAGDVDAAAAPASAAVPAASDRYNGDVGADGRAEDKRIKSGEPVSPDVDKAAKGKVSGSDSKSRAGGGGRRHSGADGGGGKDEGGGTRDESSRRRAEKEAGRRETTDRDRDRERERAPDKDYGHGSSRNGERSSEKDKGHHHAPGRDKEVEPELYKDDKSKRSKDHPSSADVEVHPDRDTGRKKQDDLYYSDTDRRPKKQIRDESSDKGKSKGVGKDSEDRANDLDRNGVDRNAEKHRRYRDNRDDAERDRRSRDERHGVGADRPSRDHSNERSENRYQRDMNKRPENHRRQDKDLESTPSIRDHSMKYGDGRVRKRSSNEKEESIAKSRGEIGPRTVSERNMDLDYNNEDRGRPESVHSNRVDSNSRLKEPRRSPNSAVHILQDESRALSKDRNHTSSASSGDRVSISGAAEKVLDSYSGESNPKPKGTARSADYKMEDALPPRSDSHLSANLQMPEKSPRGDRYNIDRKGNISGGSPGNIPPPTIRHGSGGSSLQGSAEYDGRAQSGDYRNVSRHKRNGGDPKMGRGQGSTWNGVPSWPSPVPNGYIPFPHGPPGPFHQVGQQYAPPSLFGVRPLDFNHAGVQFHMHEVPDRFPGRPFGWRNPSGDSGPQFQGWEGNAGVFGHDSHMFGSRGEWEHGRRLNNPGWETSGGKGNDERTAMDLDSSKRPDMQPQFRRDDALTGESRNQSKGHQLERVDMRQKAIPVVEECDTQTDSKINAEPALKSSNDDKGAGFLGLLLSKLDVSVNLTCPELYNRVSLNRNGDNITSYNKVVKQIYGQAGEKLNQGARSLSRGIRPPLPTVADDIFKKAVSLYKIVGEMGNEVKLSQDAPVENNDPLKTCSDENKTSAAVPSAEKDTEDADAIQLPENSLASMAVDNADIGERELVGNTAELVGDQNNNNIDSVSNSSRQLSSNYLGRQAGSDLVENCAKECVALIPEFVTRIHSPGSSH